MVERTIVAVMEEGSVTTRTCVSDEEGESVGVLWAPGDAIGVYSVSGSENAKFTTAITEPAGEAAFTGSMANTPKYAYYPYNESNNGKTTLNCELPLTQEYSYTDGMLAYDYKVGVPSDKNEGQFIFNHIFALLRISVNATGTAIAGEKLESVTLTFPDQTLSYGTFTTPVSGGDITWGNTSNKGNTLTLNWTDTPAMESGKTMSGFLNCPPASGLKGKELTVALKTSNYSVSFRTTLNVDSFQGNYIYTFPLTLSKWAEKLGDDFVVEKIERPSITSLSFTAADNNGKILAKKLFYDWNKSKKNSSGKTFKGFTNYDTSVQSTTQVMTVDNETGTITGCIPYLYDRNLVPTISKTDGASIQYSTDGNSFADWDGKSSINFSTGSIIRVSKNGMNRDYIVNITNTGLPVLIINQPGGDTEWDHVGSGKLIWSKETTFDELEANYPGSIAIYNADGSPVMFDKEGATVEGAVPATVRLRGNVSKDYPKKPFAIKFGNKQGVRFSKSDGTTTVIPAHKRWILLANWKDKSLIRNHISLGIARLFSEHLPDGIPWNVRGEFVEVIYNGVHIGNYYFCEQIKIDKNRLNISDPYETKNTFSGDWTDYGYLLESDDYYDEPAKFTTRHCIPFMFKDDVDGSNVILDAVKDKVLDIENNIYNGYKYTRNTRYGSKDGYTKAYADLDLPSVVDQLLIYEMTMTAEFRHPKSLYSYIDHKEGSQKYGKLCAGPVWDFDFETFPTLGADWVETSDRSYTKSIMATTSLIKKRNINTDGYSSPKNGTDSPFMWWPLLISDGTFTQTAADRWNSIKDELLTFAEEVRHMQTYLAESWKYNNEMWPIQHNKNCDRDYQTSSGFCGDEELTSFDDVCNAFYNAYINRLNGMNDFVSNKSWPTSSWESYISYR